MKTQNPSSDEKLKKRSYKMCIAPVVGVFLFAGEFKIAIAWEGLRQVVGGKWTVAQTGLSLDKRGSVFSTNRRLSIEVFLKDRSF